MSSDMAKNMESMIDASISDLDKVLDEAKKYLLTPEMFMRYVGAFQQGAAQLITIVSSPAVRVYDISGKPHFLVAGEKWKLFMAAQFFYSPNGNEGHKEIKCTNPITYKLDTFTISKHDAIKALNDYEEIYDASIAAIMDINDLTMTIGSKQQNSEKLEVLREVVVRLRKAVQISRDFYKVSIEGH